jgi:hypothetical protein
LSMAILLYSSGHHSSGHRCCRLTQQRDRNLAKMER